MAHSRWSINATYYYFDNKSKYDFKRYSLPSSLFHVKQKYKNIHSDFIFTDLSYRKITNCCPLLLNLFWSPCELDKCSDNRPRGRISKDSNLSVPSVLLSPFTVIKHHTHTSCLQVGWGGGTVFLFLTTPILSVTSLLSSSYHSFQCPQRCSKANHL